MASYFISEPVEFRQLEGKAIDFRKTFDLRGHGTDEMLQLYLRKANLCDDVGRLPAEQRRAYVYDIIRSNKGPGYWVPPSMQVSSDVFANPPPAVRPPPLRPDNISLSMSKSSSLNSLSSLHSTTPSSSYSTNVMVSQKGSKYEISGPSNFQHISGDVTRDRTRNAFDLSASSPDNVLKKYMMENGITEEDISGMRRQDVIKKIVQSNFTWLPSKDAQSRPKTPTLVYATISTNNQLTPPPSPKPIPAFTNYATVTSRFVDITDLDDLSTQAYSRPPQVGEVVPVKVQTSKPKIPPPPSTIMASNTHTGRTDVKPAQVKAQAPMSHATIAPHRKPIVLRMPPPAPPKPKPSNIPSSPLYAGAYKSIEQIPTPPPAFAAKPLIKPVCAPPPPPPPAAQLAAAAPPPPPPPPPALALSGGPPPPPLPMSSTVAAPAPVKNAKPQAATGGGDDRDAFLESIRQGVKLKKVDQKAATISGVKPRAERKPPAMDFLSELKLGITQRRIKNPEDNPFSEANADESNV